MTRDVISVPIQNLFGWHIADNPLLLCQISYHRPEWSMFAIGDGSFWTTGHPMFPFCTIAWWKNPWDTMISLKLDILVPLPGVWINFRANFHAVAMADSVYFLRDFWAHVEITHGQSYSFKTIKLSIDSSRILYS